MGSTIYTGYRLTASTTDVSLAGTTYTRHAEQHVAVVNSVMITGIRTKGSRGTWRTVDFRGPILFVLVPYLHILLEVRMVRSKQRYVVRGRKEDTIRRDDTSRVFQQIILEVVFRVFL